MVLARRPISANKGLNERYREALREAAALKGHSGFSRGPLYARIVWFHKDSTEQDVDNIAKRILDSFNGLLFADDRAITHCLTARIDATIDYELSEDLPREPEGSELLRLLANEGVRNVLYVEVGAKVGTTVHFGEVT